MDEARFKTMTHRGLNYSFDVWTDNRQDFITVVDKDGKFIKEINLGGGLCYPDLLSKVEDIIRFYEEVNI